jgi:hypothetical protein
MSDIWKNGTCVHSVMALRPLAISTAELSSSMIYCVATVTAKEISAEQLYLPPKGEESGKNLLTAQRTIGQYGKVRARMRWKEWVRAKTKGEITEKWLTRTAIRGG